MSSHYRPNGRPVHPACECVHGRACTCDILWDYWDGTVAQLERHIEVATRAEGRRRARVDPGGVDPEDVALTADVDGDDDLLGFWRESERLKDARK